MPHKHQINLGPCCRENLTWTAATALPEQRCLLLVMVLLLLKMKKLIECVGG
jgi:hypothetical protein